jgi:hypothetical protein
MPDLAQDARCLPLDAPTRWRRAHRLWPSSQTPSRGRPMHDLARHQTPGVRPGCANSLAASASPLAKLADPVSGSSHARPRSTPDARCSPWMRQLVGGERIASGQARRPRLGVVSCQTSLDTRRPVFALDAPTRWRPADRLWPSSQTPSRGRLMQDPAQHKMPGGSFLPGVLLIVTEVRLRCQ